MDPDRLLAAYVNGRNPAAFEQLVRRYQPLVISACRRYLANEQDVEDAAQQVFVALSEQAETIHSDVGGWLHGCAANKAKAMIRADVTRRRHEHNSAASNHKGERHTDHTELNREIDECLEELDPSDREVIIQHFMMGRTQASIADDLGISQQAVQKRVAKASEKLRSLLRQRGVTLPAAALAASLLQVAASAGEVQELAAAGSIFGKAAAHKTGLSAATKVLGLTSGLVLVSALGFFLARHTHSGSPPQPVQSNTQWFRVDLTPTPSSIPTLRATTSTNDNNVIQHTSKSVDGYFTGSLIADIEIDFGVSPAEVINIAVSNGELRPRFTDEELETIEFLPPMLFSITRELLPGAPIGPSEHPLPVSRGRLENEQGVRLLNVLPNPEIILTELPSNGPDRQYVITLATYYPIIFIKTPHEASSTGFDVTVSNSDFPIVPDYIEGIIFQLGCGELRFEDRITVPMQSHSSP